MSNSSNAKQTAPIALAALRRSAKAARRLAEQTGTPCYVQKDGKIVDITAKPHARKS
jgi:hypothetical protein